MSKSLNFDLWSYVFHIMRLSPVTIEEDNGILYYSKYLDLDLLIKSQVFHHIHDDSNPELNLLDEPNLFLYKINKIKFDDFIKRAFNPDLKDGVEYLTFEDGDFYYNYLWFTIYSLCFKTTISKNPNKPQNQRDFQTILKNDLNGFLKPKRHSDFVNYKFLINYRGEEISKNKFSKIFFFDQNKKNWHHYLKFFEPINYKNKKSLCLFYGCSEKAISSHIIPESKLRHIYQKVSRQLPDYNTLYSFDYNFFLRSNFNIYYDNFIQPEYTSAGTNKHTTERLYCHHHDSLKNSKGQDLEKDDFFLNSNIEDNSLIIDTINKRFINSFKINVTHNWQNFEKIDKIRMKNFFKMNPKVNKDKVNNIVKHSNLQDNLLFKKEFRLKELIGKNNKDDITNEKYKSFIIHNKNCLNIVNQIKTNSISPVISIMLEIDKQINVSGINIIKIKDFFRIGSLFFLDPIISETYGFKKGYVINSIIQKKNSTVFYYSFYGDLTEKQISFIKIYFSQVQGGAKAVCGYGFESKTVQYNQKDTIYHFILDSIINNFLFYGHTFFSKNIIDSFNTENLHILFKLIKEKGYEIQEEDNFVLNIKKIKELNKGIEHLQKNTLHYRRTIISALIEQIYPMNYSIENNIINFFIIEHSLHKDDLS